jgi:hypothetical protein
MCTNHYVGYIGCNQQRYNRKDCEPKRKDFIKYNIPNCKTTISRGGWIEGICEFHIQKLKLDSRKKEEEKSESIERR